MWALPAFPEMELRHAEVTRGMARSLRPRSPTRRVNLRFAHAAIERES